MNRLNKEEIEMLKRALFNQRLQSIDRINELTEQSENYYLNRISQECDDIKIINEILKKIEQIEKNEKG